MTHALTQLSRTAIAVAAFTLGLGFLPGAAATATPTDQPVAPRSQAAPESAQAKPEKGLTVVGELRTVDSSLAYIANGHRQVLKHPGAKYVKVHFESLRLARGESVTVSNVDGTEAYTYRGDPTVIGRAGSSDFTTDGGRGFWAMSIDGDTALVTLRTQRRVGGTVATIDKFWRGYTDAEIEANNPSIMSVCGTDARRDVVCYQSSHPTEYARGNAVARVLKNGGAHCTSWRVGNTNRMLTNNHCAGSQSELNTEEFQFNYQCATCGGNNPGAGTKVSGDTMLKTSGDGGSGLDYTLFSVNNFDSISSYGTLYLDNRVPTAGERIYIIGHGDGDPKELSLYNNQQSASDYCSVNDVSAPGASHNFDYMCDTSGGSSGSPVFAASSHKVIGLHHLGGCPNEAAKISLIYPQISSMIDNTPPGGNDFSVSISPAAGATDPGGSVSATVATTTSGSAQTVTLAASGLPSGATASFSPSSVTSGGSSTMTIATSASTPAGTYSVTVTGSATSGSKATTFSLTVNGPAGCSGTNATDVAIGDNSTVNSTIAISGCTGNASASSTVEVHIQHTYIGDLVVSLVAPDGTVYTLQNRSGGSADNIDKTYTVNLSSEARNGTWTLRVTDAASQDIGKIDTWTLTL
ncbi:MAG: proprotein convertase P-domain-containing protein [Micromonosporaceae bacterium]